MSRQLAFSVAASVMMMASYVLFGTSAAAAGLSLPHADLALPLHGLNALLRF
jgi:hypothetical protein